MWIGFLLKHRFLSLHLKKKEQRIGGAGNVALNLQSLGAKAYVITVTGDDDEADSLKQLFEAAGYQHAI
jgi:bifunctional ADP-heptose synthase (sugar kinase/adenylyltransferase)